MRRHLQILTVIAALAAANGSAQAQTLNAAKIDGIKKAADSFVVLAKDSEKTGRAPRYSDAAAKPLLDIVFNTKDIEGGKPLPWSSMPLLQNWYAATQKVGIIYYLAGTGTSDAVEVSKDPKKTAKANSNTVTFAPEFARYYDAQIRIHSAMVDMGAAQLAAASDEQKRDPEFKKTLTIISDSTARAMVGVLGAFAIEGLSDDWLLLRAIALLDITPKAAKFMTPQDRQLVKSAAAEVAEQTKNPDVKSGLNTVARGFAML